MSTLSVHRLPCVDHFSPLAASASPLVAVHWGFFRVPYNRMTEPVAQALAVSC